MFHKSVMLIYNDKEININNKLIINWNMCYCNSLFICNVFVSLALAQ